MKSIEYVGETNQRQNGGQVDEMVVNDEMAHDITTKDDVAHELATCLVTWHDDLGRWMDDMVVGL